MTNITINTKNTKKRGNGMKKILAILLAIITVFAMSIPAFAADETAKDVDNTFDNYTPAPGKTAPENWYDPYCYDEDGHINKYAVCYGNTVYCPTAKKIFTDSNMGRTNKRVNPLYTGVAGSQEYLYNYFLPYYTLCTVTGHYSMTEMDCYYCPYCGLPEYTNYDFDDTDTEAVAALTHKNIGYVTYCWYCDTCEKMSGSHGDSIVELTESPDTYHFTSYWDGYWIQDNHCKHVVNLNTTKLYRFLTEEQRNSEYSFIFEETADQFGDGVDGKYEDLIFNEDYGHVIGWNQDGNVEKPSFGEKIANFFKDIGDFFVGIIQWFQKLFGIVK